MTARRWACLEALTTPPRQPRLPVWLEQPAQPACRIGCVAVAHLPLIRAHLSDHARLSDDRLHLRAGPSGLAAALDGFHRRLLDSGTLRGWRDETYALVDLDAHPPGTTRPRPLVPIERAAARFWGALTLGAHANGYVAGPDGRPRQLWIARRSARKATDPGRLDNLVGGGVPVGQSPFETLVREGWEEAGLEASRMRGAQAGQVFKLHADIPEGLQREHLHVFDIELPAGLQPLNQDGEVESFTCLPVDAALDLAAGTEMTVDAALCTLDFALRHGLLPAGEAERARAATDGRRWPAAPAD